MRYHQVFSECQNSNWTPARSHSLRAMASRHRFCTSLAAERRREERGNGIQADLA
jgi:hypothetical protein